MQIILKKILITGICLLFFAAGAYSAPMQLQVVGTELQTIDGCPFRLVGVNASGNEYTACGFGAPTGYAGDLSQTITGAINTWKANVVRIPLNQDFWFGYSDGNTQSSTTQNTAYMNTYRTMVDNAIATASNLNCYVELDLHWSGNGNWGSTIPVKQQDMPDDHSINFWQDVAVRYANNPAVIFNLYNEPKGTIAWSLWRNGGTITSYSPNFHTPGHQPLVQAIRDKGARNLIVAGGLGWAWDMTGVAANALVDRNTGNTLTGYGIAYEAHIYDNKGGVTAQDKINLWNQYVTVAVAAGYCVFIGEFGPATDGSQNNSGCTPFESNLISWINGNNPESYVYSAMAWNFSTEANPVLLSSWSGFTPTGCHGTLVKNWLAAITPMPTCANNTSTRTPTRTSTPVNTATFTATRTRTPANTMTYTRTPTGTRTNTPVNTATYTETRTNTPLNTATRTSTMTSTPVNTATYTVTRTQSNTPVPSGTPTGTAASTLTGTPQNTQTGTMTATGTVTLTVTGTGTRTQIATRTFTATSTESPDLSPTGTPTWAPPAATNTATVTATETEIPADTETPLPTATDTQEPITATSTPSLTATGTAAAVSNTPTQSQTPAVTATDTPGCPWCVTETNTPTSTAVVPASPTNTYTLTRTQTLTPSGTRTPVPATSTPSVTVTIPPTSSPTSTPALGTMFEIADVLPYPNPCNLSGGSIYMGFDAKQPADTARISVYTAAFRKVLEVEKTGNFIRRSIVVLSHSDLGKISNGTYYIVIKARSTAGTWAVSRPAVLLVIR